MQIINGIEKRLLSYKKNPTNKPIKVIIHHTGGIDSNPLIDTSHHTFKNVLHWHKYGRGWDTIGYHYFIDKTGKITQGRPEEMHGAHTIGHNKVSIGICLAGNFDATLPTKEQTESLTWLLKDIGISEIRPHRVYANKTCFGNLLADDWATNLYKEKTHNCFDDLTGMEILGLAIKKLSKGK